MKRKAFILTEILTGMMLQVMFAVVLCSAFYMILNFSTNAQQGFAANDKGQMVIAYFDSRIRNAGLGLWKCPTSKDIRDALTNISGLQDTKLCLPVAVLDNTSGTEKVSHDRTGRFYSGNVLTLLYAHKDPNEIGGQPVRLILLTDNKLPSTLSSTTFPSMPNSNKFLLIDNKTQAIKSYTYSNFAKGKTDNTNIRRYAVMESSGVPVRTDAQITHVCLTPPSAAQLNPVTVYPMSEMLNLVCQKLYTAKDSNGYNFKFMELNDSGNWGKPYYHTKDILDLHMTLDTRPKTADKIPIFELRVLVSEGINEQGTTSRPKDWPGQWTADFSSHKVHVSKASWKLYNLAPMFR